MRALVMATAAGAGGARRDERSRPGRRPRAAGLGWPLLLLGALLVGTTGSFPSPAPPITWQIAEAMPEAVPVVISAGSPSAVPTAVPAVVKEPVDGVDFTIRVPALDYSATVREGVDRSILDAGPGHYPVSGWPGDDRTVAVAAHNTYWIRFGSLQSGDEVILETRWGTFSYQVTGRRIVNPNDASVVVRNGRRDLLLTTCWPLWAGAYATQRLIISAEQVGGGGPA